MNNFSLKIKIWFSVILAAGVAAIAATLISNIVWMLLIVFITTLAIAGLLQASVMGPITEITEAIQEISTGDGDLTCRLPVTGNDEMSELAVDFNRFIERVHGIVKTVAETAQGVDEGANILTQLSQENARSIGLQQKDIHQVVSAIKEMTTVVQDVTRSVSEAADSSLQADKVAIGGRTVVTSTMGQIENLSSELKTAADVIDRLRKETVGIGSVLDTIRGIAEQTNLLALNAAIEAARAGEQGRGFAVVADEVRTLASRTQSSTTEIQEMIERLQKGAQEAVEMMTGGTAQADATVEKAGEATSALEDITHIVGIIRDRTNQIATASEEQSAATQQIEQNIDSISGVAASTAESSSRISSNSSHLAEMANEMMSQLNRFKI